MGINDKYNIHRLGGKIYQIVEMVFSEDLHPDILNQTSSSSGTEATST